MSPRKLTAETKKEILKLYRETGETTSSLADRYGVSSSTISRFLKSHLTESEYEDLIQQKRLSRTPEGAKKVEFEKMQKAGFMPEGDEVQGRLPLTFVEEDEEDQEIDEEDREIDEEDREDIIAVQAPKIERPSLRGANLPSRPILAVKSSEKDNEEDEEDEDELGMDVAALGELFGEDLSDLDEDEEDEDEEDDWEEEKVTLTFSKVSKLQILPLSSASFPKNCYLVIDRAAELITRPLKEFADLGKIPSEEIQQRTLPVFDNHRVARRFSKRRERVIKVPDGRLIEKTRSHLEAKGITRLLLDGQIYSLV